MEKNTPKMRLPKLDDLFTNHITQDDLEKVIDININDIEEFPNHPFKVIENDELLTMSKSIVDNGVLVPAIVRPKGDGKYEMISGHRRKRASELANIKTLPCVVRDLTDDEATIIMVDSNIQRENILPSEKAFAYKLKLEAIKHQGKETSRPLVDKLKSADIIGLDNSESGRQVQRYIRLTELIPKLLDMVDNDSLKLTPSMAFRPAVEISYLSKDEQEALLNIMKYFDCSPSLSQAIDLKNAHNAGNLSISYMKELLQESKPNQTPSLRVSMNKLCGVLPQNLKNDREREDYVIKAVQFYVQYQSRLKEKRNHER